MKGRREMRRVDKIQRDEMDTMEEDATDDRNSGVARIFCGEVLFTNKRNFFVGVS